MIVYYGPLHFHNSYLMTYLLSNKGRIPNNFWIATRGWITDIWTLLNKDQINVKKITIDYKTAEVKRNFKRKKKNKSQKSNFLGKNRKSECLYSCLHWCFSCFLCRFCSTGVYSDYNSSFHLLHQHFQKNRRNLKNKGYFHHIYVLQSSL